jgi:hypothetical protein
MRQEPALRQAMKHFAGLARSSQASARLYEVLKELGQAVPAFALLVTDERLAAARLDAEQDRALHAQLAQVGAANREAVEEFLADHPEVHGLIAVIEASQSDEED